MRCDEEGCGSVNRKCERCVGRTANLENLEDVCSLAGVRKERVEEENLKAEGCGMTMM